MQYKPKDPNEPSMDIDTMRQLATSLVLLRWKQINEAEAEEFSCLYLAFSLPAMECYQLRPMELVQKMA